MSKRFMSKTYPGVRTRNGGATWMGHLQWTEDGKQKNVNTPAYPTEEAAARAQDKLLYKLHQEGYEDKVNHFRFAFDLTDAEKKWLETLTLEQLRNHLKTSVKAKRSEGRTSQFRGVSFEKQMGKYRGQIRSCPCNCTAHLLGFFEDEDEAALVYDRAAIYIHGSKAQTNFWYDTTGNGVPDLGPGTASQPVPCRSLPKDVMALALLKPPRRVSIEEIRRAPFPKFKPGGGARKAKAQRPRGGRGGAGRATPARRKREDSSASERSDSDEDSEGETGQAGGSGEGDGGQGRGSAKPRVTRARGRAAGAANSDAGEGGAQINDSTPRWAMATETCVHCHQRDYRPVEEGFGPRTLMTCSQCCIGAAHVGCEEAAKGMELDVEEVLGDADWYRSTQCEVIATFLGDAAGVAQAVGEGTAFTVEMVQHDPEDRESKRAVSAALAVFREAFEPLLLEDGSDLLELVSQADDGGDDGTDYSGFRLVLLRARQSGPGGGKGPVVCAATLRINGGRFAEMPFVATNEAWRRRGCCRLLLGWVEGMLRQLEVRFLVVPVAKEVYGVWSKKFGFSRVTKAESRGLSGHIVEPDPDSAVLMKKRVFVTEAEREQERLAKETRAKKVAERAAAKRAAAAEAEVAGAGQAAVVAMGGGEGGVEGPGQRLVAEESGREAVAAGVEMQGADGDVAMAEGRARGVAEREEDAGAVTDTPAALDGAGRELEAAVNATMDVDGEEETVTVHKQPTGTAAMQTGTSTPTGPAAATPSPLQATPATAPATTPAPAPAPASQPAPVPLTRQALLHGLVTLARTDRHPLDVEFAPPTPDQAARGLFTRWRPPTVAAVAAILNGVLSIYTEPAAAADTGEVDLRATITDEAIHALLHVVFQSFEGMPAYLGAHLARVLHDESFEHFCGWTHAKHPRSLVPHASNARQGSAGQGALESVTVVAGTQAVLGIKWRAVPTTAHADPLAVRRIREMSGKGSTVGDFAREDVEDAMQLATSQPGMPIDGTDGLPAEALRALAGLLDGCAVVPATVDEICAPAVWGRVHGIVMGRESMAVTVDAGPQSDFSVHALQCGFLVIKGHFSPPSTSTNTSATQQAPSPFHWARVIPTQATIDPRSVQVTAPARGQTQIRISVRRTGLPANRTLPSKRPGSASTPATASTLAEQLKGLGLAQAGMWWDLLAGAGGSMLSGDFARAVASVRAEAVKKAAAGARGCGLGRGKEGGR